jgi:hypothetical protein
LATFRHIVSWHFAGDDFKQLWGKTAVCEKKQGMESAMKCQGAEIGHHEVMGQFQQTAKLAYGVHSAAVVFASTWPHCQILQLDILRWSLMASTFTH